MRLKDKVAIISGAGLGIGRAVSVMFAREGAKVVVATRTPEHGMGTVKMIEEFNGEAVFIKTNVTKYKDAENAVNKAVETYGKLNILYNNASIEGPAYVELKNMSEEDFDNTFAVNVKGTFLMSKAAIPVMIKANDGCIINTASTYAYVSAPGFAPYCASKSAILGLARVMALELAKYNIRVNAISPSSTLTPMLMRLYGGKGYEADSALFRKPRKDELFVGNEAEKSDIAQHPIGRLASPSEIAAVAVLLASEDSNYKTGSSILVDGAFTTV